MNVTKILIFGLKGPNLRLCPRGQVGARPCLEYPGLSQVGRHKGVGQVAWDKVEPDSPVGVWKALGLMDSHLQSPMQKQPFWRVSFIIWACNWFAFITHVQRTKNGVAMWDKTRQKGLPSNCGLMQTGYQKNTLQWTVFNCGGPQ